MKLEDLEKKLENLYIKIGSCNHSSEKEAMENLPDDSWDEHTILPIFKKRFEWD